MLKEYDFPVSMFPLTAENIEIPNRFAVIRTDTNIPLGIVSDKYAIVPHSSVLDGMRQSLKGHDVHENVSLVKDGAQMVATYTFKDIEKEVVKGDVLGMQLVLKNSYDGSSPVHMSLGAIRLVCENGMTLSKSFMHLSMRHIGNVLTPDVDEIQENISLYTSQFGRLIPTMSMMATTPIELTKDSFGTATKLPAYICKEAENEYKSTNDKSLWGYYNSFTFSITHKARKESPGYRAYYTDQAWKVATRLLPA